jgi:hypothetical protein
MVRPLPEALATRAALFAIPFAIWALWWAWARYTHRPMGSTPWPWLFAAGAVLVGISLMAGVLLHRDNRGEVYVPAEATPSGKVVPGHYEEPAPKRP